jgi:phosphohistidine swiveling domain-containing protein
MKGVFNITNQPNLTKGKIYNIRIKKNKDSAVVTCDDGINGYAAVVTCDDGINRYVNINNFVTLDEHRDKIINSIIDESSIQ